MKFKKSIGILVPVCAALLLGGCGNKGGFVDPNGGDGDDIIIYKSTVVYEGDGSQGTVTGLTQGNPGDVVTIKVLPGIGFELDTLKFNGADVTISEDGSYKITLIEGENKVSATFKAIVDNYEPVFDAQHPVSITIKTSMGQQNQKVFDAIIERFKTREPNIKVTHMPVGGGYNGLAEQTIQDFNTGDYGDMVLLYPDSVADFISAGKAFDISPYMNDPEIGWTSEDLADIPEEYINEGSNYSVAGTYSLPFSKSTEALYYDADKILDLELEGVNNGLPITPYYIENLTWEELFGTLCPALIKYDTDHPGFISKTHAKGYGILGYDSSANLFITLAKQYGYDYTEIDGYGKGQILFNNDQMKGVVNKFNEYGKKHYVFTKESIDGTYTNDLFNSDAALFSIGSTGGVTYQYPKNGTRTVYAAPIPHPEGMDRANLLQGPSMCFLQHKDSTGAWDTDRQKAAWLFYQFATNLKNSNDWAVETHYMPIRKQVYETLDYQTACDPTMYSVDSLEALIARSNTLCNELSKYFYSSPAFKGSAEARRQVEILMGKAIKPTTPASEIDGLFATAYTETMKAM